MVKVDEGILAQLGEAPNGKSTPIKAGWHITVDLRPHIRFPLPDFPKKADAPVGGSNFTFGFRRSLRTDIQRFPVPGWLEIMI